MSEKITYQEYGDTKTEYIDQYGDKMSDEEIEKLREQEEQEVSNND
jgi:hypothetical protein